MITVKTWDYAFLYLFHLTRKIINFSQVFLSHEKKFNVFSHFWRTSIYLIVSAAKRMLVGWIDVIQIYFPFDSIRLLQKRYPQSKNYHTQKLFIRVFGGHLNDFAYIISTVIVCNNSFVCLNKSLYFDSNQSKTRI